jgi:hypothetical protein
MWVEILFGAVTERTEMWAFDGNHAEENPLRVRPNFVSHAARNL